MRWFSAIFVLPLLISCAASKPCAGSRQTSQPVSETPKQRFIENITIQPSHGRTKTAAPTINNTATRNTFSVQHNIPEAYPGIQFKYAILMDVPVEALDNLKLFAFIDDWYGTPYRFGGSSKSGIDCSAFTGNLMTTVFGMGLPRMAKDQYNVCQHIKKDDLEEGDLVFFHTTRKGISHVGVYLGNNKFVHASLNYGVTISDMSDGYYARTFRGGGRAKQVQADTAGIPAN